MSEIEDIIRTSDEKADFLSEVVANLERSNKAIAIFVTDDPDDEAHYAIRLFGTGRSYEVAGICEVAKLILYNSIDNVEDESE